MSMSQSTGQSSIVTGIIELGLGTAAVICGIVSMSKHTSTVAATVGIWALFVSVIPFTNTIVNEMLKLEIRVRNNPLPVCRIYLV